jgi:polyisoprenoid-binding protein YceI
MRKLRVPLVAGIVVLAMCSVAFAQGNPCNPCNPCAKKGTVFTVDDPMGRNSITFRSEAPLEDIVGTSNKIKGHIMFDPMNPNKGGSAKFMVATSSLTTGIPLRDEHLQSADWLAAKKYDHISLEITKVNEIKQVKKTSEYATYDVAVEGKLSIRGKSKTVKFPARITYLKESEKTKKRMPGNLLATRAEFEVALADFGIKGPTDAGLVGTKVGDTITVEVSVMGTTADMKMAANPCNPCGGKNPCNPCNPCGGKNPCNPCGK